MGYANDDDLVVVCSGDKGFVQAFDYDGDGKIGPRDREILTRLQAQTDRWLDTYFVKMYRVPLLPVDPLSPLLPDEVRGLSARMILWRRMSTGGMATSGAADHITYEADVKWLEAVAKGDIALALCPQPAPTSMRAVDGPTDRPGLKDISRRKLWGFS